MFQVKSENVLFDFNDCQTKCPIRRQTIRSYPPGTALFVGDECVCGREQETIYEYVPPVQSSVNVEIPVSLKPKTNEHRSDNRVMGNYGSLVFWGNIQIMNLMSIKNEDIYKGCCNRKPSKPSSDNLIMNNPVEEVTLPTTISGFNEKSTTSLDVEKCTDKNVSMITESVLQKSFTKVNEVTSENIVTDESDPSDESESPVTLTSLDIEVQTSTVNPKQNKVSFTVSTAGDSTTTTKKIDSHNDTEDVLGITNSNSYHNNKPDLEILIINSNIINFNKQQRFRLKTS